MNIKSFKGSEYLIFMNIKYSDPLKQNNSIYFFKRNTQ